LALLANVLTGDVLNGWNGAGQAEVDRAEVAANRAVGLDPNYALTHFALGKVHRLRGNHQAALDAFNEARRIDPNLANSYSQAANELVFLGRPQEAIPLAEEAVKRNPKDPSIGVLLWVKGRAYFTLGDYPNAIKALEDSVRVRPNLWYTQAWLAAAYALANADANAQSTLVPLTKNFPQYDLARITKYYNEQQYKNPTLQAASAQLLSGLRKAGLK